MLGGGGTSVHKGAEKANQPSMTTSLFYYKSFLYSVVSNTAVVFGSCWGWATGRRDELV